MVESGQIKQVKIVIYVPVTYANAIRQALAEAGAGHIGNYDTCSFSVKGIGRFRPLKKSQPFIGEQGKIEEVEEERIETVCLLEKLENVVKVVKEAHPYEEPVIDILPLIIF